MEIILDIQGGEDGRAVGTVRIASRSERWPFSGNLELLAVVEQLYQGDPGTGLEGAQIRGSEK